MFRNRKKTFKTPRFTPEEREAIITLEKFASGKGMDMQTYLALLKVGSILEEDS